MALAENIDTSPNISDVLDHYLWSRVADREVATSFPGDDLTYKVLADTDMLSPMELATLRRITRVAEVNIQNITQVSNSKRAKRLIELYSIRDPNFDKNIRFEKETFAQAGIHPHDFALLLLVADHFSTCIPVVSNDTKDESITVSYVIIKKISNECIEDMIYYAFGVSGYSKWKLEGHAAYADQALCILYQSRHQGMRTREEIASVFEAVSRSCESKNRELSSHD